MQSYISHPRGTVFNPLIIFCHYLALLICYEKYLTLQKIWYFLSFLFYGKYDIPSIAENHENMIFTLSAFTETFFFSWNFTSKKSYTWSINNSKRNKVLIRGSTKYNEFVGYREKPCIWELNLYLEKCNIRFRPVIGTNEWKYTCNQ